MRPRVLSALLAVMALLGLAGWFRAIHWAPTGYPLQGIDLDEAPPPVEWGTVRAAGADFAYLVATAGADRREPSFEGHWTALPEAGLRRGAVHLYSLCQAALPQANAFNTVVPLADDMLPSAVDIAFRADCAARPPRVALLADLARFIAVVEAHTRRPVLLRVGRAVEREYGLSDALHRPVWALANFRAPDYAARPWRMWRASDMRRIDGIDGPVNWDVVAR